MPPPRPRRRLWPWFLLVALLGFFIIAPIVFAFALLAKGGLAVGNTSSLDQMVEEKLVRKDGPRKIVRIDLEGVITGSGAGASNPVEAFEAQVNRALRDDSVAAIVVRIKSPGGEVTASDLMYHALKQADAKKPVIAYLDTIAASGGYYTACGARRILAHETTLTGSIGVIIQSPNYQQLFEKVGLRMDVYKSGKMKDMLSGAREATPEEKDYVQALVRQTYERFLEVVSESRGKSVNDLRDSELADGRVYSGRDALESGMVDELGFLDDAYTAAMDAAGLKNATIVRYEVRHGLFAALGLLGQAEAAPRRLEIDFSSRLLPHLQPGLPYYLHLPAAP